jgi:CYTH domain-containing protein
MGREIERKFLVEGDAWRRGEGVVYRQGYLNTDKHRTVRVRVVGDEGYLTIKGITQGATRREYEYAIPVADATEMLDELCEGPIIEKRRYRIPRGQLVWEVDEFFGDNQGLVVAEVELESEDQPLDKPSWLGKEVTEDSRYYNANLVQHPYSQW